MPIARAARRFAGANADLPRPGGGAPLSDLAGRDADAGPRAIERAGDAAARLDAYLDAMKRSGVLKEFNAEYKRRRMEATMRGKGSVEEQAVEIQRIRQAIAVLEQDLENRR